jgi:hypothetical protein
LFDTGLDNDGFMVEENQSVLKTPIRGLKYLTRAVTVDEIIKEFNKIQLIF